VSLQHAATQVDISQTHGTTTACGAVHAQAWTEDFRDSESPRCFSDAEATSQNHTSAETVPNLLYTHDAVVTIKTKKTNYRTAHTCET